MGEQTKPLDMAEILMGAYQLADRINESEEVKRYLQLKERMDADPEVQRLIREFQRKKEKFEEAQRFGHYHPDYHAAKEEAESFQEKMAQHPLIAEFLEAEEQLDRLLNEVSRTIARAVSESVRVPINDPRPIKRRKCPD
ncbi:MAG: YlbF family regulator [Planifilum sp.]|jgi:cell fate (sporulation/competence/biofilm development) regulator YlbF (YheA/YmcA/DUF963 family)